MRGANQVPDEYPLVDRWIIQPGIRLEGDHLRYDPFPRDPKKWHWAKRPTARLLWAFGELTNARDVEIVKYAQDWGVLGLCQHGIPDEIIFSLHFKYGRHDCQAVGREPLRAWRKYAELFRNFLANVERARLNQINRDKVAWDISRFAIAFGHLRPVLVRTEARELALRLGGSRMGAGLAAALSYQLLVLMVSDKRLLICAECGGWFESATRRAATRDVYCQRCGKAAAVRAASRRYYENQKRAKAVKDGKETRSE
jgi:hypothetical protein